MRSAFYHIKPLPGSSGYRYSPIAHTRRHPRFETTVRVRLEGRIIRECRGDVSARGFMFEWDGKIDVGTWVELSIRLPGTGDWLYVWGRVLGCIKREGRIGVRGWFTSLTYEHRRILRRWLDTFQASHRAA